MVDYFGLAISAENVYALFVSTHYPSDTTADTGGPVYYQQQVLATVARSALGDLSGHADGRGGRSAFYPLSKPAQTAFITDAGRSHAKPRSPSSNSTFAARRGVAFRRPQLGVSFCGSSILISFGQGALFPVSRSDFRLIRKTPHLVLQWCMNSTGSFQPWCLKRTMV